MQANILEQERVLEKGSDELVPTSMPNQAVPDSIKLSTPLKESDLTGIKQVRSSLAATPEEVIAGSEASTQPDPAKNWAERLLASKMTRRRLLTEAPRAAAIAYTGGKQAEKGIKGFFRELLAPPESTRGRYPLN